MSPQDKPHWPTVALVVTLLLVAFGFAGQGDYADALERENAQLRATAAGCRLAAQMREVAP